MTQIQIQIELETKAREVEATAAALAAAIAEENAAGAALLDIAIEKIRRALPALASRVQIGDTYRSGGMGQGPEPVAAWRGLCVDDTSPGPSSERGGRRDTRGTFGGDNLFLTSDGRWIRLDYAGAWSAWEGSECSWEATETVLSTAEVAARYEIYGIIAAIIARLDAYASGNASRRAAEASARAVQLRAVLALVAG